MSWKPLNNWTSPFRGKGIELPVIGNPKWYNYSYQRINDIDGRIIVPTSLGRRKRRYFLLGLILTIAIISFGAWISHKEPSNRRQPEGMLRYMIDNHLENEWNSTKWDSKLPVYKHFKEQDFSPASSDYVSEDWRVYNPYPDYHSSEYKAHHKGEFVSCIGPRGKRLNESNDDWMHAFQGKPKGFPEPTLGSSDVMSLDQNMCFDRIGMIGPYGYEGSWTDEHGIRRQTSSAVNWTAVDWAGLQNQCVSENSQRFDSSPRLAPMDKGYQKQVDDLVERKVQKRTAILIRGHESMKWDDELRRMLRSLIMQLSLGTGGEYECFLLLNMHTVQEVPFDQLNATQHQNITNRLVPPEFRNMTILWNEQQWEAEYPKIPGEFRLVHYAQWLPVQWFSKKHPEFDFYFNWELDVRYVGHMYDLVSKSANWARQQPRKGLWERNSRFFVPGYHKTYANFTKSIHSRYSNKPLSEDKNGMIWGPYTENEQNYTQPWDLPTPEFNDHWGVGEDADVITYNPIFEPTSTHYASGWHHWGYNETVVGERGPNRRATIITLMRVSHRLLSIMEWENQELGHHMGSEMLPQTMSLHHGLKAVYAPHPMYMTGVWPGEAAELVFNSGDSKQAREDNKDLPESGVGTGGPFSVFGINWEFSLFETTTFYYRAIMSMDFYRRIDGQKVEDIGGPKWEARRGTYCLPPMLLHPIKAFDEPDPRA